MADVHLTLKGPVSSRTFEFHMCPLLGCPIGFARINGQDQVLSVVLRPRKFSRILRIRASWQLQRQEAGFTYL